MTEYPAKPEAEGSSTEAEGPKTGGLNTARRKITSKLEHNQLDRQNK